MNASNPRVVCPECDGDPCKCVLEQNQFWGVIRTDTGALQSDSLGKSRWLTQRWGDMNMPPQKVTPWHLSKVECWPSGEPPVAPSGGDEREALTANQMEAWVAVELCEDIHGLQGGDPPLPCAICRQAAKTATRVFSVGWRSSGLQPQPSEPGGERQLLVNDLRTFIHLMVYENDPKYEADVLRHVEGIMSGADTYAAAYAASRLPLEPAPHCSVPWNCAACGYANDATARWPRCANCGEMASDFASVEPAPQQQLPEGLRGLVRLGLEALEASRDGNHFDGGDIQNKAEGLGVIAQVRVTAPCGERCICAETDDFPQMCYRDTEATKAARKWVGLSSSDPEREGTP